MFTDVRLNKQIPHFVWKNSKLIEFSLSCHVLANFYSNWFNLGLSVHSVRLSPVDSMIYCPQLLFYLFHKTQLRWF
jgi:hypothetical protein